VIFLGVSLAVLSLVVVGLALRMSGVKADAMDADEKRRNAEKQLQETAREFATYRRNTKAQLAALHDDIADLELDLEKCTTPGARRSRIERLLSKTEHREDGGNESVMSGWFRSPATG